MNRLSKLTAAIQLTGLGLVTALSPQISQAADFEFSGKVAAELRLFTEDPQFADQFEDSNLSFSAEPELYWEWNNGDDFLTFKPFVRVDQHDDERTHGDIRELSWVHLGDDWELRTGFRKVFWGVTEFQHLVDVINQSDSIEDIDGEDKLGQPMINLSLVRDWGIVDLFVLPGFRERAFAGVDGRLRPGLRIDADNAEFEASNDEKHTDLAIRWSQTIGDFDIGAHWFHGTNRDPKFNASQQNGEVVLTPYYEQIDQFGFDAQATIDSWLWKAETIWRDSKAESYWAAQAGFEYTFYGVQDSDADLGVLLEYGWDERGKDADAMFQNDVSVGARLALNDENSTELLAGFVHDLDYDGTSFQMEASRRIGDVWKVSLDARVFSSDEPANPVTSLDKDDHIQLTLERYF